MRLLVTLLMTAGVITIHALDNPRAASELLARVSTKSQTVLHDKQVRIDGLQLLARAEIERLLPLDKSVAWWHANGTEIQAAVQGNPWVARAEVVACPDSIASRWGCFVVTVKERAPTFVANVDSTQWIIDNEGSFVVPLNELDGRRLARPLVIVRGLASRAKSPDLVRAQLSAAAGLVPVLEKRVGRSVLGLELMGQGDFGVMFKGLSFPIVFAGGKDAPVPLSEQGERCAELLKHLGSRVTEVKKIDLSFSRVGVVTFVPTPEAGAEKSPPAQETR